MDAKSVARILDSYERIAPHVDGMVDGFYRRLFQACPEARALFRSDMTAQRHHLAATLALLVRNLSFRDVLDEPLMDLGAQHVTFGARPEHYPVVRASLLASLGETLAPDWTSDLQADWAALLDHVIEIMLKGGASYTVNTIEEAAAKSRHRADPTAH